MKLTLLLLASIMLFIGAMTSTPSTKPLKHLEHLTDDDRKQLDTLLRRL